METGINKVVNKENYLRIPIKTKKKPVVRSQQFSGWKKNY